MKRNHMFWIVIGCTAPLLLIFFAPAIGLGEGFSLLLFVLVMFAIHLFMPHGHGAHQDNSSPSKETQNESHQH